MMFGTLQVLPHPLTERQMYQKIKVTLVLSTPEVNKAQLEINVLLLN